MMNWSENYLTGAIEMDEDHKALFELVNEFDGIYREPFKKKGYEVEIQRMLQEIYKLSKKHFLIEESFIELHGGVDIEQYREEHKYFITLLSNYTEKLNNLFVEKTTTARPELLKQINNEVKSRISMINKLLRSWLLKHITHEHPKFESDKGSGKLGGLFSKLKFSK
jgi:hemerythrin-like metal-binding protein